MMLLVGLSARRSASQSITIKNLYIACSERVSRALGRRVYINIEQKVCFKIAPKRING